MIGSLVGGYRVVTSLGEGPSGVVYYAEHPVIGRRAAIKVLSPELSADADRVQRYITHAKVVSGIRHPNIVDVIDIGRIPQPGVAVPVGHTPPVDLTFVVMEMLEGESLGERLERGAIDAAAAVRLLTQVASAVGAAHDRGLVHAGLKNENVYITNSEDYPDFVKVLDFGSYKLHPRRAAGARSSSSSSDAYLAPEVLAGGEPDSASDIYAVGVLAYEMLVGALPWSRAHEGRLAAEDRIPPLPPHERQESVGKPLSDVVMRALATDPEQRWPTLRELRRALERALSPAASASVLAPQSAPSLAAPAANPGSPEVQRTERIQAKKVGRALSNIILRRIMENRLQLPSMPLVALKCLDVLRDPNVTFADVAKVIEQDPVIAGRILRVVNSAAYSRRDAVKTLESAISQIGVKPLQILLVEVAACQVFTSRSAGIRQKFKLIWEHCLAVGMLARDLASELRSRVEPEVAYLAGLMHDIGKPIVGGLLLEAERKLIEELDVPFMNETLWQKTVAESHRSIGAAVASAWKLPAEIGEAILSCEAYVPEAGANSCGNLVRFANTLAKREGIYVGDVSGEEIVAAVLQGREVLQMEESAETKLLTTLRDRTSAVTAGRTHRSREADRTRRARVV